MLTFITEKLTENSCPVGLLYLSDKEIKTNIGAETAASKGLGVLMAHV